MSKRILVTGSIAYDVLLGYDGLFADALDPQALENISLSFFSSHYAKHHGGTGANVAWNLRLLQADPLLVGSVGNDGQEYLEMLTKHGVATDYIEQVADKVTATAIIGTDSEECQIAFFHPGADVGRAWPDLSAVRKDIVYALVGPRDTSSMVAAMEWCDENKVPVIFDPGQQIIAFGTDALERLVRMSTIVVVNDYESNRLFDLLKRNEDSILKLVDTLIVTDGDHGFTIFNKDGATAIRACSPVKLVNPTGAGDAFRAGMLKGLGAGWDLPDACRLGAAMGSFAVEQEGTLMNSLKLEDVSRRMEQFYEKEAPDLR
ncbi:MAG: carbohydrate kinase family protein [Candidatus Peribacteraceae bacterium]